MGRKPVGHYWAKLAVEKWEGRNSARKIGDLMEYATLGTMKDIEYNVHPYLPHLDFDSSNHS